MKQLSKRTGGLLGMLLGTLGTTLLRNLITGKGTIRAVAEFSMPLHPLTNSEIQTYH